MFRPSPVSLQVFDHGLQKQLLDKPELGSVRTVRHFSLARYTTGNTLGLLCEFVSDQEASCLAELTADLKNPKPAFVVKEIQKFARDKANREVVAAITSLELKNEEDKVHYLPVVGRICAVTLPSGGISVIPAVSIWDGQKLHDCCQTIDTQKKIENTFELNQNLNSLEELGLGVQMEVFLVDGNSWSKRSQYTAQTKNLSFAIVAAMFISTESKVILFRLESQGQQTKSLDVSKLQVKEMLTIDEAFGKSDTSDVNAYQDREMLQSADGLLFHNAKTGLLFELKFSKLG